MRSLVAAILVVIGATSSEAQSTNRYSILFHNKMSGHQVTQVSGDGSFTVDFTYRDNGRGPDLKEEFALADDGSMRRYAVKGASTFGAAIDETFTRDRDAIEWKSIVDKGNAKASGAAAYVPIECSSEVMARVVRAVALQPGGKIKALPAGQLEVEKLADERVEVNGQTREISLYALKGYLDEPYLLWMTRAPELILFAAIEPGWMHLTPEGWESVADVLEKRQLEVGRTHLETLAVKLSHRWPEPILIRNARVFDSEHATLGSAKDGFINRGRIAAIYETGALRAGRRHRHRCAKSRAAARPLRHARAHGALGDAAESRGIAEICNPRTARLEERTVAYIEADSDGQAKRFAALAFPHLKIRFGLAETLPGDRPRDKQ